MPRFRTRDLSRVRLNRTVDTPEIAARDSALATGPDAPASPHPVGRLAGLNLVALVLERVLALAILVIVAATYGASTLTDAYFLALIVPLSLAVAAMDALYTTLLPHFSGESAERRAAVLRAALRLTFLPLALALGAYVLGVWLLVSEYQSIWLAFAPLLVAMPLSGIYAALFLVERRYVVSIMRVPLASVITLLLVLVAVWQDRSLLSFALALSAGQLAILLLLVLAARAGPAPARTEPGLRGRTLFGSAGSVFAASLVAGQLVIVAERFLASGLGERTVTWLVDARGFALLPAILAQALGAGVLPAAAERHKAVDRQALRSLALLALRLGLVIALVSIAFIVVCRRELIELALERGKFTREDSVETASLVAVLAPAIAGLAASTIAGKALLGVGLQRMVAAFSAAGLLLYVLSAVLLRELGGATGLAAAFSLSATVTGVLFAVYLARQFELAPRAVLQQWLLIPLLYGGTFALGALVGWLLGRGLGDSGWAALGTVGLAALGGGIALASLLALTRGPERAYLLAGRRALSRRVAPKSSRPAGE